MIYADHAATTSLSPAAMEVMKPWLQDEFGNPSTLYRLAREPRKAIAHAREVVAEAVGASPEEIFFTSGGTEADNWAIKGTMLQDLSKRGGVVTSKIEHHAVLNPCAYLERLGFPVIYLPVNHEGVVDPAVLKDQLTKSTVLVSVMLANNEIGSIQPVEDLSVIAHETGCLMHTDAVQAVGHIPVNVNQLGVDMLSASAHKFNGPKGVGFLFVRKGVALEPLLHGGGQEKHMRAGTENVAGIVGMAAALEEHISQLQRESLYLNNLREELLSHLRNRNVLFLSNGSDYRIPGSLSLSFPKVEGERILHRLDLMGTMIATGSACDSLQTVLSHVVRAIGIPDLFAYGTIRITLGMENTKEEMAIIADQIIRILNQESGQ